MDGEAEPTGMWVCVLRTIYFIIGKIYKRVSKWNGKQ